MFNLFRACFSGRETSNSTALDVVPVASELQGPAISPSSQAPRPMRTRPVDVDQRTPVPTRTRSQELRSVASSDALLVKSSKSDPIPMSRSRLAQVDLEQEIKIDLAQEIDGACDRLLNEGKFSVREDLSAAVEAAAEYERQSDSEGLVVGLPPTSMSPISALSAYHTELARQSLTSAPDVGYLSHDDDDFDQTQVARAHAQTDESGVFSLDEDNFDQSQAARLPA